MAPERFGEWTDARYLKSEPPGPVRAGQTIHLGGRALARYWTLTIDVGEMDPNRRWIDLVAHLPFGIDNYEHLTLTEAPGGGTLVRFN